MDVGGGGVKRVWSIEKISYLSKLYISLTFRLFFGGVREGRGIEKQIVTNIQQLQQTVFLIQKSLFS